jgi:hypothetical protein
VAEHQACRSGTYDCYLGFHMFANAVSLFILYADSQRRYIDNYDGKVVLADDLDIF